MNTHSLFVRLLSVLTCAACVAPGAVAAAPSVVTVDGRPGAWRLVRNGRPYFVCGAGGGASKELLAKMGGNSFRTWGADRLDADFAEARKYGLTVMAGFWLGHAEHGFDYTDAAALARTEAEVTAAVAKFRDEPALLCWALGNEMEMNNPHRKEMWAFIDRLAEKVKALDPHHPVCTVVAEIPDETLAEFKTLAPHLDFLGINSYGGCPTLGARWRAAGMTRPYLVTEFGARGSWEGPKDANGIPLEQTSTEKGAFFADSYARGIAAEKGKMCLGSYAFTWGWKVEATPTWHGMLLPDLSVLASAQAVQEAWGRVKVRNRCPVLEPLDVTGGMTGRAECRAHDPDGDALTYSWVLLSDTGDYDTIGTGLSMPEGWDGAILEGQGTARVKFRLPGGGVYRLYCYVFDGKGHAACANVPLKGEGATPRRERKPAPMPLAVYADADAGAARGPWVPSGYMGNTRALKVDERCADRPFAGETCLRVEYTDHIGWAGIFWQDPANDWGEKPGGRNLAQATTLVFRACGERGGEKVDFFVGGLKDKPHGDSAEAKLAVTLKKEWTRYRIPLDGKDLSQIKTGFGFSLASSGDPVVFYLDEIIYTAD